MPIEADYDGLTPSMQLAARMGLSLDDMRRNVRKNANDVADFLFELLTFEAYSDPDKFESELAVLMQKARSIRQSMNDHQRVATILPPPPY